MASKDYADLEVGLYRRAADAYVVDFRFTPPDSDTDTRLTSGEPFGVDTLALRAQELDLESYGRTLGELLLGPDAVGRAFAEVRASAAALQVPLRLRLLIDESASELHGLRWEAMRDPRDGAHLFTGEQILFSRYLSSRSWRSVALRPRSSLRALVAVASPRNSAEYALAPIDGAAEVARARQHFGAEIVVHAELGRPATLPQIVADLRPGYDILYLVCHGAMIRGQPVLYLQDEHGDVAATPGEELVVRLGELREQPRLVVLASCESAGDAALVDGSPLAAIGPRLAEAGIPAVVAMQGRVGIDTVARFMPAFFAALQRHGEIDRAMAEARGAVRDAADYWMPVLFMRLRSGRIWYTPGFAESAGYDRWEGLIGNIGAGLCTPILGPLINEPIFGSPREIAHRWSDAFHFPLESFRRDDLAQVAQYLAVYQDWNLPRRELATYLRDELLRRFGDLLPQTLDTTKLRDLFAEVGKLRRAQGSFDSYQALAHLPFRIYITACTDSLLREALVAEGKRPVVEICRWNERLVNLPSPLLKDPGYTPSAEQPLIFHLFGVNAQPESLVLTEDDYFDYLIGVSLNKRLIPEVVRDALVDRSLVFLGFHLEDWSFRVLFRSLMSHEGRARRDRYANIAGQLMPEEGEFLQPERARAYLQRYFGQSAIDIFWGSVTDFLQELAERWERKGAVVQAAEEDDPFY